MKKKLGLSLLAALATSSRQSGPTAGSLRQQGPKRRTPRLAAQLSARHVAMLTIVSANMPNLVILRPTGLAPSFDHLAGWTCFGGWMRFAVANEAHRRTISAAPRELSQSRRNYNVRCCFRGLRGSGEPCPIHLRPHIASISARSVSGLKRRR